MCGAVTRGMIELRSEAPGPHTRENRGWTGRYGPPVQALSIMHITHPHTVGPHTDYCGPAAALGFRGINVDFYECGKNDGYSLP